MKKIDLTKLTHLGSDYNRNNDYYFDSSTGNLYKRHIVLTQLRNKGQVDCAEETLIEMIEGNVVYPLGSGPVLSRDN